MTIVRTFWQLRSLFSQARLVWRLVGDPRVPLRAKLVAAGAGLLLLSPLDIIPDALLPLLGLGVADDVTVLLLAATLLVALSPKEVVAEHRARLRGARRLPRETTSLPLGFPA
ncbi:MAG: hypothetical protein KatS3mg061_1201 [Dehalococcoidia bacterium]|nr:MAG: hypothetical protein KatS3mg061_1201 [Dehalococcoidia bacterium]